mgnify:CR=1 FL=1
MRGSLKVPVKASPGGIREDLSVFEIPNGWLEESLNWFPNRGVTGPRPAYSQIGETLTSADRITGIAIRGDLNQATNIVFHTLTAAYHWNGTTNTDITGDTWNASTIDQLVRMVTYRSGGTMWLARINGANEVEKWDGTSSAFQNIPEAPLGVDMTVVGGYLVVIQEDGTVVWNKLNDIDTWPALNINPVNDTPGDGVAIKALTPLSFAVYKTDSVYIATLQAAKNAFQFQRIELVSGPLSAAAVVEVKNSHYWISTDHVIRRFNGSTVEDVSRGAVESISTTVRFEGKAQTHGYSRTADQDEVWWRYADIDSGDLTRGISCVIREDRPEGQLGVVNLHTYADPITASMSWRTQASLTYAALTAQASTYVGITSLYPTYGDLTSSGTILALMGDASGKYYQSGIGDITDDGTAVTWSFKHPFRAYANFGKRLQLDGIASYWKTTSLAFTVTVNVIANETGHTGGTASSGTFLLASSSAEDHIVTFPDEIGQFVSVEHTGTSIFSGLAHRMVYVMGWPQEMV